ncbi:MAG: phosphate ABC transporter permease PstA [Clostridia bacterium]|jgi:phosphate transport system permease protein|nr:phosphate ABC transporter permease PstA [Clostridia bacterium]
MEKIKQAKLEDKIMTVIFYIVAGFFLILLLVFASYVIIKGFSGATSQMFTFTSKGVLNQLFNTVYLVLLSLIISCPLGIGAGIYLAEYAKRGKLTEAIQMCIETLSSLPSIVVGLFGYLAFILMTGMKWNLFAGALAVSILCLPLITTTTFDAVRALPDYYRYGSMGLGATKWQTIYHVLIPSCMPRIVTGIILAAGRGFGEAAALLYTSGMSTDINWSNWNITSPLCPLNPFRPGETLSLHIWASFTEATAANAKDIANLSSAILMILVLVFNITVRIISKRIDERAGGGK